ncbi:Deoxyribonuclease-2-beta [Trichinella sp. T8]|nr:Deoxyribonuclease-2-beta [Trichinella sp. T8]
MKYLFRVNLLINYSIVIQCSALNVDMSFSKKCLITCIRWILMLWAYFPSISQATSKCQNAAGAGDADWAILYKAPAQTNGKILFAGAAGGNWAGSPQSVTLNNGHSFAKALEHVIAANAENKFISYNNDPPDVPKVRTKSNSKGVLMMDTGNNDAAAWIVHTVPGFPKARTGYLFPPAEVQKGHLLICLTIKEDQIDTIGVGGGNWGGSPQPVTAENGHSFARALEHVIRADGNNKFISYNNIPPDVPKVKTKSNSKGVLMMDITGTDAAAWIVHTVPGFPKARTGYLFPPAEVQKGHLLICLTIKENQIDTIGKYENNMVCPSLKQEINSVLLTNLIKKVKQWNLQWQYALMMPPFQLASEKLRRMWKTAHKIAFCGFDEWIAAFIIELF